MIIDPRIFEKFGDDYITTSGSEILYCCPYCEEVKGTPDLKGNLYVNNNSLLYFCQRCGSRGHINDRPKGYDFEKTPNNPELVSLLESVVLPSPELDLYEIPDLVPTEGDRFYDYLVDRDISPQMISYYNIRKGSVASKYKGRVIVPNQLISKDGKQYTDMFVARYIGEIPKDPNGKPLFPKYLNPYGENKRSVVFNLHRIPVGAPIIITEGVFTAISAGRNAVCTYGKYVTDIQINKILSKRPSSIYVNLDGDAYDRSLELCKRISYKSSAKLYIVRFSETEEDTADANSIGHSKYMRYLSKAKPYNPVELSILDSMGIDHRYLNVYTGT